MSKNVGVTIARSDALLVPGHTCWRIERANRFAFIVDAADYFRVVKAAMLKAKHSIVLIGWDFDTRIKFEPQETTLPGPNRLGRFLSWLLKRQPDLRIYVLKWDLGVVQALGRGMTPVFILNWITNRRISFRLDGAHPAGAAHHQKLIVIDGALAFCGGIDMTTDRWDTSDHLDDNPLRTKPSGRHYGPWHDATTAVDGDAARALWDMAQARWKQATGEPLPTPASSDFDPWPEELGTTLGDVDVGISRTLPELEDREEAREIEALYLEAIAQAERTIYLESQYLASRKIAEALEARLCDAVGPEIIIVLPETTVGWLEHKAMDGARRKLLQMLWRADRRQKLGVFYPVTANGNAIYVHAKVMVIDDRLLRVGSSNLNNRSMGYDSECDLSIEALKGSDDEQRLKEAIRSIRNRLLSEHLDVSQARFNSAVEGVSGSLLDAVKTLRGSGRTLIPFDAAQIADEDSVLAENELLDPEHPAPSVQQRVSSAVTAIASRLGRRSEH